MKEVNYRVGKYWVKRTIERGELPTIKKLKQLRDGGIDVSKFVEQSIKMLQELK